MQPYEVYVSWDMRQMVQTSMMIISDDGMLPIQSQTIT